MNEAEEIVGEGPSAVYVYFAEAERRLAAFEGRERWPCKVGFTTGDVMHRVKQQRPRTSSNSQEVVNHMDDHQIERARGMHAMSEAEYEQHMREQMPRVVGQSGPTAEQARAMQGVPVFSEDTADPVPPKRKPRLSWWNRLFG